MEMEDKSIMTLAISSTTYFIFNRRMSWLMKTVFIKF
jgi:hypothetical protein